jgi:hypothetical protein
MSAEFSISFLLDCAVTLQDNGPAYVGSMLYVMLPHLCEKHGYKLLYYVHNESGDGKTWLDAAFGVVTQMLRRKMIMHDILYLCRLCLLLEFMFV